MPVYNKRGILLLPKVIVLNPKDGPLRLFLEAHFLSFIEFSFLNVITQTY